MNPKMSQGVAYEDKASGGGDQVKQSTSQWQVASSSAGKSKYGMAEAAAANDTGATNTVGESTIRLMTRLSQQHNAVNLSQGYPNEPPPFPVQVALAHAVLSGVPSGSTNTQDLIKSMVEMLGARNSTERVDDSDQESIRLDVLNQYSPPMGRPDVREAITRHYRTMYDYDLIDAEKEVTVTLGATEAFASALRTVGRPGDGVVIFEPFHELYPSQCDIFYLRPLYVTLREASSPANSNVDAFIKCETANNTTEESEGITGRSWTFDVQELSEALSNARILVLNTPHNPTGKVFSYDELSTIASLCVEHNITIITDEIYEHMTYGATKHLLLIKSFPLLKERTFLCNSISKSASATGWRVGWCIHPSKYAGAYRGIHDQLVVMSPHPMQYATLTYLDLPDTYFRQELRERYIHRMTLLRDALHDLGFTVPPNAMVEGAYYWFVRYRNVPRLRRLNPMDAAMYMITDVGVGCVPGDNFYGTPSLGNDYLRFAACRSLDDVEEACRRMRRVLSKSPTEGTICTQR